MKKRRKPVWYSKPDDQGFFLIIRKVEKHCHTATYRVELQKEKLPHYQPYSLAIMCGRTILYLSTPEYSREKGYARTLLMLAKKVFPSLKLTAPISVAGRHLYRSVVKVHPDMVDPNYESNPEKHDPQLDRMEEVEGKIRELWVSHYKDMFDKLRREDDERNCS